MKNVRFIISAALAALLFLTSCEKTQTNPSEPSFSGLVILNEGKWGDNNSSIVGYDDETGAFADVFSSTNGKGLGDTGQDILLFGDDIFIAVNMSQIIFVTDRTFRIKKEIVASENGVRLSPRYFATDGKKVYVTYYEGYLGEIDPSDGYRVRTTAVGPNPEGVAYSGGKLYVANSGGYLPGFNNTVSVVDAASFKEVSTFEVNANPATVIANSTGTALYISSLGDYTMASPILQSVDLATMAVSDTGYEGVSHVAYGGDDKLYVLCAGYDAEWNPLPGTIYVHDAATDKKDGKFAENIEKAYKVSADAGYVFVTSTDYVNTGDIYIFNQAGEQLGKFDTQGLNPGKGIIVR
ncbi:MAG: hypothetical protein NC115_10235 [Bacteroidales bacterium]|nr:hypothetical protein [Bacteroidales bacterium]